MRRLKIGRTEQMDALARAAGGVYCQVVVWFWRTVRHKDLWLTAKHVKNPLALAMGSTSGEQPARRALGPAREAAAVLPAALGPDAGLIGVALLVRTALDSRR